MVGVTAFAFRDALFFGGSMVPSDIVDALVAPFNWDAPVGATPERASGDVLNIHSHWTMVGRSLRGDWSWWDRSLGMGYPTMKGGLPAFSIISYALFPAWFAAGAAVALRTVVAWWLTYGWLRTLELQRLSAYLGGAAFAFSGFLMGWSGWPHAIVAAFAPGLLWAIECALRDRQARAGVPIGLVAALMVWANFPLVTAYVLIGAGLYVVARLLTEFGWRGAGPRALRLLPTWLVASIVGIGLAFPHIVHFAERLAWADTSSRAFARDSSAGGEYLLTAALPAAFGTYGHGPDWWGIGTFVEMQIHVGGPVLLLSLAAWAATRGKHSQALRRRGAVAGAWAMAVFASAVGDLGGPLTNATQAFMGDVSGHATRSKVLISLGFAGLAAFGFDAFTESGSDVPARLRRSVGRTVVPAAVLGLFLMPSLLNWLRDLETLGHQRSLAVASIIPVATTVAVAWVLFVRSRRELVPRWFAPVVGVVVVVELLAFATPLPTIVGADDRLSMTAEHEDVIAALEPGGRLGGEANLFFPNTTQLFEIDAHGGDVLRSPGHMALLNAVDARMFTAEFGGTFTYPAVPVGTDPTLAVWDALGLDLWASPRELPPLGPRVDPPPALSSADPFAGPVRGEFIIPEGGLRAVLLRADLAQPEDGRLDLVLISPSGVETTVTSRRDRWPFAELEVRSLAVDGEHFAPGDVYEVEVRASGPQRGMTIGVDADGALLVGTVSGTNDGLDVIATGAVTLYQRVQSAPVRLHDAVVAASDPDDAAAIVVGRDGLAGSPAVLDTDVDLPLVADPAARLDHSIVRVEDGSWEINTSTDRPAVLVIAENDYPGWRATIDGESASVFTADAALIGIVVPAGDHVVRVDFRPTYLTLSIIVVTVTAVFAALVWFGPTRFPASRSRAQIVTRDEDQPVATAFGEHNADSLKG